MEGMSLREEGQEEGRSFPHKMHNKKVLRNQKDFDAVYRKGKSAAGKYVVVFYKRNNLGFSRISFLASKKVGNSVQRNRARRLMKEAMRTSGIDLPSGYDFIVIARNSINGVKCRNVQNSLYSVMKRTGVFKKK